MGIDYCAAQCMFEAVATKGQLRRTKGVAYPPRGPDRQAAGRSRCWLGEALRAEAKAVIAERSGEEQQTVCGGRWRLKRRDLRGVWDGLRSLIDYRESRGEDEAIENGRRQVYGCLGGGGGGEEARHGGWRLTAKRAEGLEGSSGVLHDRAWPVAERYE
jgi:hypothetical protein